MNNTEKLLEAASRKLGISVESLKEALGNKDLDAILKNMNKSDAEKIKAAAGDPEALQNIWKNLQN